ncbi:hypothetical protein IAU60_006434 [Kwoniella sp. DSM 27419]
MNEPSEDQEPCPLCPSAGPPQPPGETSGEVNLTWIACTKCDTWYHAACIVLGEATRSIVPSEILKEIEVNHAEEGAWYCQECIAFSTSPSNPRPPRHPLRATLKKGYPPFHSPVKRSASSASLNPAKRVKVDASGSSVRDTGTSEQETTHQRPKRNVKQLDYHNLNNSIATPTTAYRHVPGELLTKEWLDSPDHPDYPPSMFYGPGREPLIIGPDDGGFTALGGSLPDPDLTVQDVARLVGPDRPVDQSSQWPLKKWADYLAAPPATNGRPSKVYNIISLEISGTPLARKVKPPRLVKEIDWVDNFWHFGQGKKSPVEDEADDARAKAKAPYPKVQLYCLDWHVDFAASSVYYTIHTGSKVGSGSFEKQQTTWLGDMVDEVRKVTLNAGDTILRQARAYRRPTTVIPYSGQILRNLLYLSEFLLAQIGILHNPDKEERSKKLVYDRIPHDVVNDGEGLAMELRWRVMRELGQSPEAVPETSVDKQKARPWTETVQPAQIDVTREAIPRPSPHIGPEGAQVTRSVVRQSRRRVREVDGGLVLEEQDIQFSERKVVWGAA